MLILTRRLGESIAIADNIKISVLGISGKQVSLGIEAPKKIPVYREEIYLRMQEEKASARKLSLEKLKNFAKKFVGKDTPKPRHK